MCYISFSSDAFQLVQTDDEFFILPLVNSEVSRSDILCLSDDVSKFTILYLQEREVVSYETLIAEIAKTFEVPDTIVKADMEEFIQNLIDLGVAKRNEK